MEIFSIPLQMLATIKPQHGKFSFYYFTSRNFQCQERLKKNLKFKKIAEQE